MQLTGTAIIFFGASVLLDRLPKARFVAAPSAIQVMKEHISPEFAEHWSPSAKPPLRIQMAQAETTL